jgi:hypothetical protein
LNTSKNVGLNTLAKTYGNTKINSPESINRVILKKEPFLSRGSFNLIFIDFYNIHQFKRLEGAELKDEFNALVKKYKPILLKDF